jgi:hypothetical protein
MANREEDYASSSLHGLTHAHAALRAVVPICGRTSRRTQWVPQARAPSR